MIQKIHITKAKNSFRFKGAGLTKAELACIMKLNEIVEYLNKKES